MAERFAQLDFVAQNTDFVGTAQRIALQDVK